MPSHLKYNVFPVLFTPVTGKGRRLLTPFSHLRMYPLLILGLGTSTVKPLLATTRPGAEVEVVFALTSSKLGVLSSGERAVTRNLEFVVLKLKLLTMKVPPLLSSAHSPPMLPPLSTMEKPLLTSEVPPKKPAPVAITVPLKDFLFPVIRVFPFPMALRRRMPVPAISPFSLMVSALP